MSEYKTPYQKESTDKIHIASENVTFRWFFFIFFVLFLLFGGGMMAFSGLALNKALNERSELNALSSTLSDAHLVSGHCWTCDAKTGVLTIISDKVESDLTDTDPRTEQFPTLGISMPDIYIPSQSTQDVTLNNLNTNIYTGQTETSASIVLGNSTKYAIGVTGLPAHSTSTMNIGVYNGDTTTVNSRCDDITSSQIYIMYKYNILTNSSDFFLCMCHTSEYCKTYPSSSFTLM
jgi:hypothetical protein